MYDTFYNVLKSSLQDLQLHHLDTDSYIISYIEGKITEEYLDLGNLDPLIKANYKKPGKFKYQFRDKIIDEFIVLSSKTYSIKYYNTKEKGIKKED